MIENAEERGQGKVKCRYMKVPHLNGFKIGKVLIHIIEDKPSLLPAFHHC